MVKMKQKAEHSQRRMHANEMEMREIWGKEEN